VIVVDTMMIAQLVLRGDGTEEAVAIPHAVPLVTRDRQVIEAFPAVAVSPMDVSSARD